MFWEQTRMLAFYQYIGIPKKNKNPSYQRFKLQHLPFPWDSITKELSDEEIAAIENQNVMSGEEWMDRIRRMQSGPELTADNVEGKV